MDNESNNNNIGMRVFHLVHHRQTHRKELRQIRQSVHNRNSNQNGVSGHHNL